MKKICILLLLTLSLLLLLSACSDRCRVCSYGPFEVTVDPTCEQTGTQIHTCTVCGHMESSVLEILPHDFGDWVITNTATCTDDGTRERVCQGCGLTESEVLPMLETVYTIKLDLGYKTLTEPAPASGDYFLHTPEWNGMVFMGWVDADGNPFPKTGTVSKSQTVTALWEPAETATFAELKARIEAGAREIRLVADIVLTDTIYVVSDTVIVTDADHTLTRAPEFLGDLFVLGCDAAGNNILLQNDRAALSLCPANGVKLVVDGNKANMTADVGGSAFFLVNSSILNIYDNVEIINCKKTDNLRLAEDEQNISNAIRAGGAAVLIVNGACNMYGGRIADCEISVTDASNACLGGAVYNHGTFNMYGGTIENSLAARGGAVYNYRTAFFYGGTLQNNHASTYGGAIYLPDSQYTYAVFGAEGTEIKMNVLGNTCDKSGGAIFASHQSTVAILGGTLFSENKSLDGNGGAINLAGELVMRYAVFANNTASSKGGAIYGYYNKAGYTTRYIKIFDGVFTGNAAPRGGAIALSKGDNVNTGARAIIERATFRANSAPLDDAGEYGYGGAFHVDHSSFLELRGAQILSNTADDKGGAIYVTKASTVNAVAQDGVSTLFDGNISGGNGGAVYLYTDTVLTLTDTNLTNNTSHSASYGGGALYLTGATATLTRVTLSGNSAYQGGAISLYSTASLSAYDTTLKENSASNRGGAMYLSNSTLQANRLTLTANTAPDRAGAIYFSGATMTASYVTLENNTAGADETTRGDGLGGAFGVYSGSVISITGLTANGNTAHGNGGCIYISGSSVTVLGNEAAPSLLAANASTNGNGGAISVHSNGTLTLYGATLSGNAANEGNGGALYVYGAFAVLGDNDHIAPNTFHDNAAQKGGAIFISTTKSASVDVDAHTVVAAANTSTGGGGALYIEIHKDATTATATLDIVSLTLTDNAADGNGGALYIYTSAQVSIGTLNASGNTSAKYGGVIYASGKSTTVINTVIANSNTATTSGGFLYLTTTGTTMTLNGGNITGNTATSGSAVYSNSSGAVLQIKGGDTGEYLLFDSGSITGKSGFAITAI